MGMANMDFVIRECQAVVEGPLAMIRLGTCGAIQRPAHLGNFLVASEGSICVRWIALNPKLLTLLKSIPTVNRNESITTSCFYFVSCCTQQ